MSKYLQFIPTDEFPNELFRLSDSKKRASKLKIDLLDLEKSDKKNNANKLAYLGLTLAKNNKNRHEAIQRFMITNDSTTVATEVPVYLTENDLDYYKNNDFSSKLLDYLTPIETLNFFCELKGEDKSIVNTLLKDVGLSDAKDRRVGTFSKGMAQLLGIAQAMIGSPSIYIFDEPMSGLDAKWVKVVRDKINMLNAGGKTVMFSSHILSEVQNLCDRVLIINRGKLIALDSLKNLSEGLKMKLSIEIFISNIDQKATKILDDIDGIFSKEILDDRLIVEGSMQSRAQVITKLTQEGYNIENFRTIETSLEDVFVKLTEGGN